jgi:hypothetical protein
VAPLLMSHICLLMMCVLVCAVASLARVCGTGILLDPEDRGILFLRIVGGRVSERTTFQHIRQSSSRGF